MDTLIQKIKNLEEINGFSDNLITGCFWTKGGRLVEATWNQNPSKLEVWGLRTTEGKPSPHRNGEYWVFETLEGIETL